jgi:hypothetical protein
MTKKAGNIRRIPRRALYVGFSRSTSLSGLYIKGEFHAPDPPDANDKVVIAMEKLRQRPVLFSNEENELGKELTIKEGFKDAFLLQPGLGTRQERERENRILPLRRIGHVNICPEDMMSLGPQGWLTDSVMFNKYLIK